jgi:hypothetical protein
MSQARKPAAKPAGARTIFNVAPVAARLRALRQAAIDDGKEDSRWWAPALAFEWAPRSGANGTQWTNLNYTDEHNTTGRLFLRVSGEKHTGQIMPLTEDGCAEMAKLIKNPKVKVTPRTKKACFQVQKWKGQVKTEEDGITLLSDSDGNIILPDDSLLSPYYEVATLVNEAFTFETKERIERGGALVTSLTASKKAKVTDVDGALAAFHEANGPKRAGDMILSSENVTAIRKMFPEKAAGDRIIKGAIVTGNMKVAELVQTNISTQATRNAGMSLPNPMTRIALNFDKLTGVAEMAFFDKSKPFIVDGKPKYEAATVEDKPGVFAPVNAENVHKFIRSRARMDGIVDMGSVCFSSMGISMPVKGEVAVVEPPTNNKVGFDDVYDEDGVCYEADPEAVAEAAAAAEVAAATEAMSGLEVKEDAAPEPEQKAAPKVAAAAKAKPAAKAAAPAKPANAPVAVEAVDYNDLLNGLGGE